MWYLVKYSIQLILFIIWGSLLTYLILLSSLTFILFNICLSIFLFWFILTLISWSFAFIPILKYVFIPWHRRQCHLWTQQNQQSQFSIAFFHPISNKKTDQERILWAMIESIFNKYSNDVQILIYTGDILITSEELLQSVKDYFNIDLHRYQSSIIFIHLQTQFLIDQKTYKYFPLLGPSIGSIIVSFEALIHFVPDIYIDSIGYAFTYPCFYYIGSVSILSYFQHPIIRNDLFDKATEQYTNSFLSRLSLIYYDLFCLIYGWCGSCSKMIFCNSTWTKKRLELTWNSDSIHILYPPVDVEEFSDKSIKDTDEQKIVSIGEFRLEKNHELQIRAFHQFLQRKPEYVEKTKLILIGSIQDDHDKEYVEQLRALIESLNINKQVELKINLTFKELKVQLQQATIGLQTMKNEEFGIGIVEMMAAGLIVLAHKSGGATLDIIEENQTGFFAYDLDSYATMLEQIFDLTDTNRRQIHEHICDRINRFNRLSFDKVFFQSLETILFVK